MEKNLEKMSMGPGLYMLKTAHKNNEIVYPFSPTVNLQKSGVSTIEGVSLIEIDSELMGLNRIHSNDPNMKYKPQNNNFKYNHLKDGFFETEHSRLTNDNIELKYMTKNRFNYLHVDPTKYSIEPFERTGVNTHLKFVDNYQKCPNPF
tara:strand:+ start:1686 stop:2129 length:444 start_codon:yes stop_codon:yes gene_type:complete